MLNSEKGYELAESRVLVTGGSGLIGSHLVDALIEEEKVGEVLVVDNIINRRNLSRALTTGKLRVVEAAAGDVDSWRSAAQNIDYAFHLAAMLMLPGEKDPRTLLENDIVGFFNLLTLLTELGVKKLIFASSIAVYGSPKDPSQLLTEESPIGTRDMYGAAKIVGEVFCRRFYDRYGLNYLALRYGVTYGPRMGAGQFYQYIITRTLDAIKQDTPLNLEEGERDEIQDFTYVGDVVRANIIALKSPVSDDIFNIVSGSQFRLQEIVESVMEIKNCRIPIQDVPRKRIKYTPIRRISGEKAQRILNFKVVTSLEEGLDKFIGWYEEQDK
jgi:UDP-glucose 4-epimerase